MLLAGLLPLIEFSQTPYINQNQLPKGSTMFSGIDPPTLIINQDNKSHRYSEVNIGGNSSIEAPCSHVYQVNN